MNAIQILINRCLQEAHALHMVEMESQSKKAQTELNNVWELINAVRAYLPFVELNHMETDTEFDAIERLMDALAELQQS